MKPFGMIISAMSRLGDTFATQKSPITAYLVAHLAVHQAILLADIQKKPEQKIIVEAFTDSYNNILRVIKDHKPQAVKGGFGASGNLAIQGNDEIGEQKPAPVKTISKKKKTR
ncbi:hypothetical protein MCEMSEM29_00358 [Methylophilaceae bacterium]